MVWLCLVPFFGGVVVEVVLCSLLLKADRRTKQLKFPVLSGCFHDVLFDLKGIL